MVTPNGLYLEEAIGLSRIALKNNDRSTIGWPGGLYGGWKFSKGLRYRLLYDSVLEESRSRIRQSGFEQAMPPLTEARIYPGVYQYTV